MTKKCLLWLLCVLSFPGYGLTWRDFWFTKDQQGQRLMREGQFKRAETTFQDPAWRGAAAYRSGNYEQAAEYYRLLQNEQGFYNEGNALAKLRRYEQAIRAYDKALSLNPKNEEAAYNRKLLTELLKQKQNKQQQAQNQQGQDQQRQNQQGQNQENQNQQGQNQQGQNQQGQNQQGQNQQGQNQQGQNQQGQNQQGQNQQGQNQQNQNQQGQSQQGQSQQGQSQQGQNQQDKSPQGQVSKNSQAIKRQNNSHAGEKLMPEHATSASEQEKQQAKQQWLKLIPDDPGGLLREKFLRDHIRRQHGWYE
jgi:Ca-activated chloride channel family protein